MAKQKRKRRTKAQMMVAQEFKAFLEDIRNLSEQKRWDVIEALYESVQEWRDINGEPG